MKPSPAGWFSALGHAIRIMRRQRQQLVRLRDEAVLLRHQLAEQQAVLARSQDRAEAMALLEEQSWWYTEQLRAQIVDLGGVPVEAHEVSL